jgi:Ca2+/H+ antiporter, TMEM165/GDT1 family
MIEAILNSALLVFASEMGDKTQLLALILVARYKQPWTILLGVLIATLANHAIAAGVGAYAASFVSETTLRWILGVIFFVFAAWILIPDEEGEVANVSRFGVLMTTIVAFFIAEMGDKTQLAGMLGSNALAVFLGERLLKKIPMKWVRITASILFVVFGLVVILS